MTLLLPRAPMSEPWAAAASTESAADGTGASRASSTDERRVRYMFEPVSPSGTGKTFRSLISCWLASSQDSAAVSPARICSPAISRSGSRSTASSGAGLVADTISLRMDALDVDVHRHHRQSERSLNRVADGAHQVVGDLADSGPVLDDHVQLDHEPVRGDLNLDPAVDVLAIQALGDAVAQAASRHAHDPVRLVGCVANDRGHHTRRDLDPPEGGGARERVRRPDLAFHVSP